MTNRYVRRELKIRIEGDDVLAKSFAEFLSRLLIDDLPAGPYPSTNNKDMRYYLDVNVTGLQIQAEATDLEGKTYTAQFPLKGE
jgi:hypothetical protein